MYQPDRGVVQPDARATSPERRETVHDSIADEAEERVLTAAGRKVIVDGPIERAVPVPQAEIIVHRAARRMVFGQIAPLAAGAQDVRHPR